MLGNLLPGQPDIYAYRPDEVVIGPLESVYEAAEVADWYDEGVDGCPTLQQLDLFLSEGG